MRAEGSHADPNPRHRAEGAIGRDYFNIAKNQCGRIDAGRTAGTGELARAVDLDLLLRSKRNSAIDYRTVIDIRNFCASDPTYDVLRHNAWIRVS